MCKSLLVSFTAHDAIQASSFEEPPDIPSLAGDRERRRNSISASSIDEEAALESELKATDDIEPSSMSLLDVDLAENASMNTQEPPSKKKGYEDAMDIVLSKVKNDKKRSEQKIRYLSELHQEKDKEITSLKKRLDSLRKEKENGEL